MDGITGWEFAIQYPEIQRREDRGGELNKKEERPKPENFKGRERTVSRYVGGVIKTPTT